MIKVVEVFVNTDDPKDAELQIKEMGLDVFKKGAVKEILPQPIVTFVAS